MLKRVCVEAAKLDFELVNKMYDCDSDRRLEITTMRCERNGQYKDLN